MTPARSFPNRRRLGAVLVALLSSAALCGAPAWAQVEVQALAKLDLFSTGRDTGFGMDVWKGSSADIARSVIPTLAAKPLSPAGTSLARRLLAQAATAPDGAGDDADLAAARVKALMALGDAGLADNILDRTPGLQNNGPLSQVAAEAALITGQDAKACAIGEALVAARDGPYWLRLRTYCQVVAGKTEAAQLTFTLATQQAKDPVFNRLMGAAINPAAAPGAASLRDGLELALSRRLKLDLTPALPGASLAIANQLAADSDKAAAPGALPAGLTPFSPMPDSSAPPPAPPTEAQVTAPLKAAKSFAVFLAAAKAARPAMAGLAHGTAPLADPVLDASAALAAGDIDSAQAIRAGMTQDSVPGSNPVDLALLDAALSAAVGKPDAANLDRLAERGAKGDPKGRPRAQAGAAIYSALGGDMGAAARAEFVTFDIGKSDAPAARSMGLEIAADRGLVGETALLALTVAQGGGAAGPPPVDRARIVRALVRAGRGNDAQAFVVEGLLTLMSR